jgi:hypothetical protein
VQVFDWHKGTPPSASEAVDIANVNKIAATNIRVTFFISVSPLIKFELLLLGKHYVGFTKTEHMFEKRAISLLSMRYAEAV